MFRAQERLRHGAQKSSEHRLNLARGFARAHTGASALGTGASDGLGLWQREQVGGPATVLLDYIETRAA
jgi:hypothetical protein